MCMCLQNNEIVLHPAMEEAREKMLKELFAWQAIILNLPRIKHTRYQVGAHMPISSAIAVKCVSLRPLINWSRVSV